jgi:GTP pyrophosphokinase
MLLAMSKDIRVILVKLADRLHNMRTLEHSAPEKAQRVGQETMEIYAPLASRMGLYGMKSELEDLSFRYLSPEAYAGLEERLAEGEKSRRKMLETVTETLEKEVAAAGVKGRVFAREKMKYSIYRKMLAQGVPFEKVYDVVGFRVIVDSVEQCWQVLGLVHQLWRPIPGRFRDYISLPKPNGYRSLHTSVMGPEGERMEIQVRTWEMHDIADRGIAAHWKYKEGKVTSPADEAKIRYLKQMIEELMELHETVRDAEDLYSVVKEGLSFEEIFVFTPKGDVKNLPRGSTPVDFAFAVHSQVGFRCTGARANGVMVPLSHTLKNGDVVEILTSATQKPSVDWLKFVKSPAAKAKLRTFVRSEARERLKQLGRALLEKELRRRDVSLSKAFKGGTLAEVGKAFSIDGDEGLLIAIGSGKVDVGEVADKLSGGKPVKVPPAAPPVLKPFAGLLDKLRVSDKGKVLVGGHEDILIKFAQCCNPVRGERIVGFVTRGRGITVHSAECQYVQIMDHERFVDVEWDLGVTSGMMVTLKVTSRDQPGMLTAVSQVFAQQGTNICQAIVRTSEGQAEHVFKIAVQNVGQLKTVFRSLQKIPGVVKVERVSG